MTPRERILSAITYGNQGTPLQVTGDACQRMGIVAMFETVVKFRGNTP